MKYCLQCGTIAANDEESCEKCNFTHFTKPTNSPSDEIAALRARVERLEVEMKQCLWAIENGGFSEDSLGMKIAKDARAVLEAK